ncbi:hypothetical protein ACRRTK_016187 [Alexandromys fortis]
MFLYWRKRGTYELETLPRDLTQLELGAVERFSWSSALDIIEDLEGRYSHFPLRTWRNCGYLVCLATPAGQSLWPAGWACVAEDHLLVVVWGPSGEPPQEGQGLKCDDQMVMNVSKCSILPGGQLGTPAPH